MSKRTVKSRAPVTAVEPVATVDEAAAEPVAVADEPAAEAVAVADEPAAVEAPKTPVEAVEPVPAVKQLDWTVPPLTWAEHLPFYAAWSLVTELSGFDSSFGSHWLTVGQRRLYDDHFRLVRHLLEFVRSAGAPVQAETLFRVAEPWHGLNGDAWDTIDQKYRLAYGVFGVLAQALPGLIEQEAARARAAAAANAPAPVAAALLLPREDTILDHVDDWPRLFARRAP